MLKHTRIAKALDTVRLGEALARPGMDTRCWVCLAIVTDIVIDPDEGPFVDVILLPDGEEETARVGAGYSGPGFGFYLPLEVDDEVLIVAPSGDPDEGLVVAARLWSASDPPPADVVSDPQDLLLHLKDGVNLRIVTGGTGNVVIDPRGSGNVRLGGETGLQPAALGASLESRIAALEAFYNTHTHVYSPGPSPAALTATPLPQMSGSPTFQAAKVEVK